MNNDDYRPTTKAWWLEGTLDNNGRIEGLLQRLSSTIFIPIRCKIHKKNRGLKMSIITKTRAIKTLLALSTKDRNAINHDSITTSKLLNSVTIKDIQDYKERNGFKSIPNNKSKIVLINDISDQEKNRKKPFSNR